MKLSVKSNKFISNTSWMVGEKIFEMCISLVIGMITARYLGPSNYGTINYCISFVTFFTSVCTLGLEGIIVKELIDNPKQEGYLLGTGIFMRCISSFLSIICIVIILKILKPHNNIVLIVGFLESIALLFRSFDLINFWYQSKLESKYASIIQSSAYVIVSLYKVFILATGKDVRWFAFSTSLDIILIAIMFVISYYKKGGLKLRISFDLGRKLLSQSYHFILSGLLIVIYAQMDKVMIGQILDEKQVGLYSVAITITGLWSFIPNALINSARPIIMKLKSENEELYMKRLKQLYAGIGWIGILFSTFVVLTSKWIVLILYGRDYLDAVNTLNIAVWYTSFSLLGVARGIWIISENKNKYDKKILFWGVVVNLLLNSILIPRYGIDGAAVATLFTQITTCLLAPLIYKETRIHTKYVLEALCFKGIK